MIANFEKGTKVCSRCRRELPIENYTKERRRPDGLNLNCKECEKERDRLKREAAKNDPIRHQKMLDAYKRYHASEKGKKKQKEYEERRVYTEEQRERRRQYAKKYHKENYTPRRQQKIFIIDEKEYFKCSKCGEIKPKEDFFKESKNAHGYSYACKECKRKQQKEYMQTEEYKQKISEWNKVYRRKERFVEYRNNYYQNRRELDPNFRLLMNMRGRISKAIKRNSKRGKSIELLGCSIEFLKQYLEKQFKPGMTWENYGTEWQVDHIVPCSWFDMFQSHHQFVCFNYRNLQPLWTKENQLKHNELPENYKDIIEYIRLAIGCKKEVVLLNEVN